MVGPTRNVLTLVFTLCCLFQFPVGVGAQGLVSAQQSDSSRLARIEVHTVDELYGVLQRAEGLFEQGQIEVGGDPIVFVLHGPEARSLFKSHYQQYKSLADLAAKLSALDVVDVKVCKTWMSGESLEESMLLPFVGTVSNGPIEIERLIEQKSYVYF